MTLRRHLKQPLFLRLARKSRPIYHHRPPISRTHITSPQTEKFFAHTFRNATLAPALLFPSLIPASTCVSAAAGQSISPQSQPVSDRPYDYKARRILTLRVTQGSRTKKRAANRPLIGAGTRIEQGWPQLSLGLDWLGANFGGTALPG